MLIEEDAGAKDMAVTLEESAHDIATNTYHGMVEVAGRIGEFEGVSVADAIARVAKEISDHGTSVNYLAEAISEQPGLSLSGVVESAGHEISLAILELAAAIRGTK